jgi:NADPH:quinone reductase-like Zn-dependent oxidoreductase
VRAIAGVDSDNLQPMRISNTYAVQLTQAGSIANLTIQPQQMLAPTTNFNEATIDVRAVGLNFRDVLNVLGLDPTGEVLPIGGEAAGIVSSVGPARGHVMPLDHVYGLVPGSLRTHAWCDARYVRCMCSGVERRCASPQG